MRVSTLLSAVLASAITHASAEETVSVFLQPIASTETPPALLAEIRYSLPSPSEPAIQPEVASYEAPEIPEDAKLLRLGLYDTATKQWVSSTSVISAENFGKGYSPHFVLSVGGGQEEQKVLGVSLRGVRIDAGQTRDFGPQAVVVTTVQGQQPELNKPVVLSPEGKQVVPVEKTLLQKYWWVLAIGAAFLMTGGGDGK